MRKSVSWCIFALFVEVALGDSSPIAVTLTAGAVGATDAKTTQADKLAERLRAVFDGARFRQAHWGLLIVDRSTGEALFEHQPDKMFAPASTTKLFSTAAALDDLGADYRFETPVFTRGKLADGKLAGDLILVAKGDLTLGGRTDAAGKIAFTNSDHIYAQFSSNAELTDTDPLAGLNELARQVAANGVKHVAGDVLIDDRLFDRAESSGSGPTIVTPIQVNDNLVDFVISPTEPGKRANVRHRPEALAIRVDAQVETVDEKETTSIQVDSPSEGNFVVRGRIAARRKPLVRTHDVEDPASFARTLFVEALVRAGVKVDASPLARNPTDDLPEAKSYADLKRVAQLQSPPFIENAKLVLKVSHNLHASTLPLLIASHHGERTLEAGMRRQHDFFHRAGLDLDGISFGGAAGGARADYVSPRATVQLLRYVAGQTYFAAYRDALPVLGVDGTLAKAVPTDSPAKGKAHAKTGTLLWGNLGNGRYLLTSKAVAGYATSASGRDLAFAFFVNNVPIVDSEAGAREIGETLGKLCEIMVVESPGK